MGAWTGSAAPASRALGRALLTSGDQNLVAAPATSVHWTPDRVRANKVRPTHEVRAEQHSQVRFIVPMAFSLRRTGTGRKPQ
jgi:hypothetical protein